MLISLYLKLFECDGKECGGRLLGNMGELGDREGEGGDYWSVDYLCMYTKTYEGKRYWLEPEEGVSGGKEESRT